MKGFILSMVLVFTYTTSGIARVGMITSAFRKSAPLIAYGTVRAYQNQRLATNANSQAILCNQRIQQTTNLSQATHALARQQILQQQKILQTQTIQTSKVPQSKVRSYPSTPTHLSQTEQKINEIAKKSAKIMKTEKSD